MSVSSIGMFLVNNKKFRLLAYTPLILIFLEPVWLEIIPIIIFVSLFNGFLDALNVLPEKKRADYFIKKSPKLFRVSVVVNIFLIFYTFFKLVIYHRSYTLILSQINRIEFSVLIVIFFYLILELVVTMYVVIDFYKKSEELEPLSELAKKFLE